MQYFNLFHAYYRLLKQRV